MRVLQSIFLSTVIVVGACQLFLFCSRMFDRLLLRSHFVRGNLRFETVHNGLVPIRGLRFGLFLGGDRTGALGRLVLHKDAVLRFQGLYGRDVGLRYPLQLLTVLFLQSAVFNAVGLPGACKGLFAGGSVHNRLLPDSSLVRGDLGLKLVHYHGVPFGRLCARQSLGCHNAGALGRLALLRALVLCVQHLHRNRVSLLCPLQLLRMLCLQPATLGAVVVLSTNERLLVRSSMQDRLVPQSVLVRRDAAFKIPHRDPVHLGHVRLGSLLGRCSAGALGELLLPQPLVLRLQGKNGGRVGSLDPRQLPGMVGAVPAALVGAGNELVVGRHLLLRVPLRGCLLRRQLVLEPRDRHVVALGQFELGAAPRCHSLGALGRLELLCFLVLCAQRVHGGRVGIPHRRQLEGVLVPDPPALEHLGGDGGGLSGGLGCQARRYVLELLCVVLLRGEPLGLHAGGYLGVVVWESGAGGGGGWGGG